MHKTTKQNLKTMADWTNDIAIADSFAIALEWGIPKQPDEGAYASLGNSFGNLTLTLYEAESVSEIKPFLLLARKCGFKRQGKVDGNIDKGTLTWSYRAPVDGETSNQSLTIQLIFKKSTKDEPATCGYVQVGVKEVPDMKLMCGEEFTAWTKMKAEES